MTQGKCYIESILNQGNTIKCIQGWEKISEPNSQGNFLKFGLALFLSKGKYIFHIDALI